MRFFRHRRDRAPRARTCLRAQTGLAVPTAAGATSSFGSGEQTSASSQPQTAARMLLLQCRTHYAPKKGGAQARVRVLFDRHAGVSRRAGMQMMKFDSERGPSAVKAENRRSVARLVVHLLCAPCAPKAKPLAKLQPPAQTLDYVPVRALVKSAAATRTAAGCVRTSKGGGGLEKQQQYLKDEVSRRDARAPFDYFDLFTAFCNNQ